MRRPSIFIINVEDTCLVTPVPLQGIYMIWSATTVLLPLMTLLGANAPEI